MYKKLNKLISPYKRDFDMKAYYDGNYVGFKGKVSDLEIYMIYVNVGISTGRERNSEIIYYDFKEFLNYVKSFGISGIFTDDDIVLDREVEKNVDVVPDNRKEYRINLSTYKKLVKWSKLLKNISEPFYGGWLINFYNRWDFLENEIVITGSNIHYLVHFHLPLEGHSIIDRDKNFSFYSLNYFPDPLPGTTDFDIFFSEQNNNICFLANNDWFVYFSYGDSQYRIGEKMPDFDSILRKKGIVFSVSREELMKGLEKVSWSKKIEPSVKFVFGGESLYIWRIYQEKLISQKINLKYDFSCGSDKYIRYLPYDQVKRFLKLLDYNDTICFDITSNQDDPIYLYNEHNSHDFIYVSSVKGLDY